MGSISGRCWDARRVLTASEAQRPAQVFKRALRDGFIQQLLIKGQLCPRPHTGGLHLPLPLIFHCIPENLVSFPCNVGEEVEAQRRYDLAKVKAGTEALIFLSPKLTIFPLTNMGHPHRV